MGIRVSLSRIRDVQFLSVVVTQACEETFRFISLLTLRQHRSTQLTSREQEVVLPLPRRVCFLNVMALSLSLSHDVDSQ